MHINDTPEAGPEWAKLQELRQLATDLDRQRSAFDTELSATRGTPPLDVAAESLLSKGAIEATDIDKLRRSVERLGEELRITRRAIELQEQRYRGGVAAASARICREKAGDYRALVRRMAQQLLALVALSQQEWQFRESLLEGQVQIGTLNIMALNGLGRFDDRYSRASAWLIDGFERGFFTRKELQAWAGAEWPRLEKVLSGINEASHAA